MRVIFLGFALPQEDFDSMLLSDQSMPVQTQRFGWSVVRALTAAGAEAILLSAAPAAPYPHGRRLWFRGRKFTTTHGVGRTLSYLNLPVLKHLTRYLTARRAIESFCTREDVDAILVHGVHSAFLWAALVSRAKHRLSTAVLLTDAPGQPTRFDGPFSRLLRVADRRLISCALKRFDGAVTVSSRLAEDFACGVRHLVVEGFARPLASAEVGERADAATVIYAGGLERAYGIGDLLEAARISPGGWRLEIYGRGSMADEVQRAAAATDRIVYGGMVDSTTLATKYAAARVLVNPRDASEPIAVHSFPSKLLEYMASGTPVISTRLPTIPKEYDPFILWSEPGPTGLGNAIESAMEMERSELADLGARAREFVLATRSPEAQGEKLVSFLAGFDRRAE